MPRIKATPVRREVHRFEEEQLPPLQTFTETSLQDGESYVDLMGDDFIEDEESELHFGSEQGTAAEDAVDLTKDESPAPTKRARVANKPIHGQEWINIQPSTISSHELYPLPLRSEGQELWYLLQQKEIPVEDKTSPLQDSIPVTAAIHKDGLLLPFNESAVLIPIDGKLRNQLVEALRKEDLAIEVVMHANLLVLQYFVHQNSFVPLTLLQFILGKDNILNQTWSDSCPTQIMPGDVAFEFDAAAFLDELNATSNLEEDDEALLELENKLHALGLVTKLRKYQLEGVNWMNKVLNFEQDSYPCAENTVGMLRMNTLPDSSHDLYYSMIESKFTAMNRWIDQNQRSSKSCILADSMGIGKSIQILSLCMLLKEQLRQDSAAISVSVAKEEAILFHSSRRNPQDDLDEFIEFEEETPCVCGRITLTKQDLGWVQCSGCEKWRHIRCAGFQTAEEAEVEHDYLCLPCQAIYHHYHQLPSKCMLLIVPPTLVNQWQMEIKKHFSHAGDKSFKILTISSANLFTISPYDILKYDIIVMDFKALRTGFHAANIDWSNRQRGGKYDVFPPSFLAIHYQLVVIDETQNIESCSENQILKMSCKLRSERRVSVSGTPFGNNKLHDLYNLVQFLKIPPFDMDKHMWQTLFEQNNLFLAREVRLSWLKQLLQPIVLRRTKAMVSNQLQLKQGMTLLRPLKLSPFEMVLYQENFKLVVNEFQGKAMDLSIGRAKLELLRKGCCHPQVFDKSLKSKGNMSQAGPRPLNEIMVMKVEQAKLSCEESQREQLFYLLTMAGIRLLQYQRLAVQDHNYPHEQDTVIKNPNQLIFLLSAMKIYKYTLSLILAGRMSTSLIAMAQVQGDHLQHSNTNMAINEHVHFEWSHSISNNSVSDNCKSMSREQEGIWQSLQVLLEEDIQLPTQCLQMVGSNGLQSSYEVKLHFMHHKSIVSLNVINSNLSFDRIASDFKKLQDTNENYREIVYVFPAEATLSAAVNGADMYLNTMKINFPFPGHSLENINSESLQKNVHKSKSWRLQISKFYDFVLVVRRTGDSLNQFDYKWQQGIPVDHSSQVMNNSQIMLQASISMYESAVETDSLQELHVCYNFRETLQMLTSIYSHHQAVFDYISKHVNIPKDVYHLRDIDQIEPSQDLFEIEIEMSKPVVEVQPLSIKKSMTMDYNLFTPLKYARQMFDIGKKKASNVHFDHEVELVDGTNADHVVLPMGDCQELRAEIYRQVLSIEDQFVGAAKDRIVMAACKIKDVMQSMEEVELEILHVSSARKWWMDFLPQLENDTMFLSHLESVIENGELAYSRLKNFRNMNGLFYILEQEFDQIIDIRKKILKYLSTLPASPLEEEIRKSADCRQCRSYFQKTGPICSHCSFFNNFMHPYKSVHLTAARRQSKRLVSQTKSQTQASAHKLGNAAGLHGINETELSIKSFNEGIMDGIYIMIMKLLKAFAHKYNITPFLEVAKSEVKWVEQLLTEANCMTILWDRYSELLKAFDELDQCKSRVQLIPDVGVQEFGIQYYHAHELEESFVSNWSGAVTSENRSKEVVGNLNFFKDQVQQYTLEQRRDSKPSEQGAHEDDEECIICRTGLFDNEEEDAVVMLTCGHKFHQECVSLWLKAHKKCPICKKSAHNKDLIHKNTKSTDIPQQKQEENCIVITISKMQQDSVESIDERYLKFRKMVIGSWGTKIDALITDLLILLKDSNKAEEKIIVFSQWIEMLEIVSEALKGNHITHTLCVDRSKDFNSSRGGIELFRNNVDVRVLLLPIALGAEGLDLIIASHVFLLEPLLNINQELQAVNRIDRIGQTKDTFVHKYVVRETIEEKVLQFQDRMRSFDHQSSEVAVEGATANSSSATASVMSPSKSKKRAKRGKGDDQLLELDDIRSILDIR